LPDAAHLVNANPERVEYSLPRSASWVYYRAADTPDAKGATVKDHFALMANYNAWANTRLYRMASQLSDEQYRRDVSAYFKSLHGTLNHLLAADRIWLRRLTGTGVAPTRLDAILNEDLAGLTEARRAEDERLIRFVESLTDEQFEATIEYRMFNGSQQQQKLREVLAHLFNHQTHHRGQAHAILTALGMKEPESLDVLWMMRERPTR
jgi:uncharacterized damage-inducible protein DinB